MLGTVLSALHALAHINHVTNDFRDQETRYKNAQNSGKLNLDKMEYSNIQFNSEVELYHLQPF